MSLCSIELSCSVSHSFISLPFHSHRRLLTKLNQFSQQPRIEFDCSNKTCFHRSNLRFRHVRRFSIHSSVWVSFIIRFSGLLEKISTLKNHSIFFSSRAADSNFITASHEWVRSNDGCWSAEAWRSVQFSEEIFTFSTANPAGSARSGEYHYVERWSLVRRSGNVWNSHWSTEEVCVLLPVKLT